mmetsp:Transcript_43139/g.125628  ORF Transcript_43139/g.125628 Transcript_43139/m.125628 type:complete len:195 (+) Transcript_43139:65-649(+)
MAVARALLAALLAHESVGAPGPTMMCAGSPSQLCRMVCRPVTCPPGSCAMRVGSCCHFACQPSGGEGLGIGVAHEELPGLADPHLEKPIRIFPGEPAHAGVGEPYPEKTPHGGFGQPKAPGDMEKMPAFGAGVALGHLKGSMVGSVRSEGSDTPLCADSPRQSCKMLCPTKHCPAGNCARRVGACCTFTCESGV